MIVNSEAWRRLSSSDANSLRESLRINGHQIEVSGVTSASQIRLDPFQTAAIYAPLELAGLIGGFAKPEQATRWLSLVAKTENQLAPAARRILVDPAVAELRDGVEFGRLSDYLLRGAAARRLVAITRLLILVAAALTFLALVNSFNSTLRVFDETAEERAVKRTLGASIRSLAADLGLRIGRRFLVTSGFVAVSVAMVPLALQAVSDADQTVPLVIGSYSQLQTWLTALGFTSVVFLLSGLPALTKLVFAMRNCEPIALLYPHRASGSRSSSLRLLASVCQVAFSVVLVGIGVLAFDALYRQTQRPLGFQAGKVFVVRPFVGSTQRESPASESIHQILRRELEASGVAEKAAIATAAPFGNELFLVEIQRKHHRPLRAALNTVDESYLDVLGTKTLAGDTRLEASGPGSFGIVVNHQLIDDLGISIDEAIGHRLTFSGGFGEGLIRGVVEDGVYEKLSESQWPTVFAPSTGRLDLSSSVVIRMRNGDQDRQRVEQVVSRIVPAGTAVDSYALDDRANQLVRRASVLAGTGIGVALISIISAGLALWTLIVDSLRRRASVVAIRCMLGATPVKAASFACAEAIAVIFGGTIFGALLLFVAVPWISSFLEGAALTPFATLAIAGSAVAIINGSLTIWKCASYLRIQPLRLLLDRS